MRVKSNHFSADLNAVKITCFISTWLHPFRPPTSTPRNRIHKCKCDLALRRRRCPGLPGGVACGWGREARREVFKSATQTRALAGNREVISGEGERGEAGTVYFWSQRSEGRNRCNLVKPLKARLRCAPGVMGLGLGCARPSMALVYCVRAQSRSCLI